MNRLYQVVAPHFVAGIIVNDDFIVMAAPILKWSIGQGFTEFRHYANSKHWAITDVPS